MSVAKARIVALAAVISAFGQAMGAPSPVDFELPGETGFLHLSAVPPKPTLVNFWRADCPPCLRELPEINRFAASHPEIRVITVALQTRAESAAAGVGPAEPVLALHGPNRPEGLLARFGNPAGALPYTVLLHSSRQLCAKRAGEIDAAWLAGVLRECMP